MNYGEKGDIVKTSHTKIGTTYNEQENISSEYGIILNNQKSECELLMVVDSKSATYIKNRFYRLLNNAYILYSDRKKEHCVDLKETYKTDEDLVIVGKLKSVEQFVKLEASYNNYFDTSITKKRHKILF